MLWHFQFGHQSFRYLKQLIHKLSSNKYPFLLVKFVNFQNIIFLFLCNHINHQNILLFIVMFEKCEVEQAVQICFKMAQTQFQTNMQVFGSDNKEEYFNMILGFFFS
ncbi:hypothetical protein CR513_16613, partial [Mucuna pruriens]